jgi:mannan endo-1,4-beta-mannosidase
LLKKHYHNVLYYTTFTATKQLNTKQVKRQHQRLILLLPLFATLLSTATAANTNLPSDRNATPKTRALFKNMKKLATRGTMIGHQDALSYGIGWYANSNRCDIKDVCGSYPAIIGYDLGNLELGGEVNLDSVSFASMKSNIVKAYKAGAISTISWHARNPLTGSDAWDISSNKVAASILPGGEKNQLFTQWLDKVASFMLSLKAENGELVPVIFRPYHELSGSWFWWGKNLCTKDDFIALWKYTIDYLRGKGAHNMLVAYCLADYNNEAEFLDRYPGNSYVDIVGFDIYQRDNDPTGKIFTNEMGMKSRIAEKVAKDRGILFAVTEAGYEALPDSTWFTTTLAPTLRNRNISYVLLWRNAFNKKGHFYAPYPGHASAPDFIKLVNDPAFFIGSEVKGIYR